MIDLVKLKYNAIQAYDSIKREITLAGKPTPAYRQQVLDFVDKTHKYIEITGVTSNEISPGLTQPTVYLSLEGIRSCLTSHLSSFISTVDTMQTLNKRTVTIRLDMYRDVHPADYTGKFRFAGRELPFVGYYNGHIALDFSTVGCLQANAGFVEALDIPSSFQFKGTTIPVQVAGFSLLDNRCGVGFAWSIKLEIDLRLISSEGSYRVSVQDVSRLSSAIRHTFEDKAIFTGMKLKTGSVRLYSFEMMLMGQRMYAVPIAFYPTVPAIQKPSCDMMDTFLLERYGQPDKPEWTRLGEVLGLSR